MEQETLLLSRDSDRAGLTAPLSFDHISQRLSASAMRRLRGDHDLNPGTGPSTKRKPAAVLVPLVTYGSQVTVLLTQRTDHLQHHAGQISFPGGRLEAVDGDQDSFDAHVAAALREAEEEIGLRPATVDILGRLDTYITRTGFEVIPVVAKVTPPLDLALDDFEVADAFEVPLPFFLDESNHQRETRMFNGKDRHFYAMPYEDRFIWGATAGMIRNLFEVLTQDDCQPRLRP